MNGIVAALSIGLLALLLTLALYQAARWLVALLSVSTQQTPALPDAVRSNLLDERRRLLNHLREIQFDFETGKLDAADYHQLRDRYEREAIAVMAALDEPEAAT